MISAAYRGVRLAAPLAVLVSLLSPAQGRAAAPPTLDLEVTRFVTPSTGNGHGRHLPVYLGYTTRTRFHSQEQAQRVEGPVVSNTVAVPRSKWGGPIADDEWMWALGISSGLYPLPRDEHADDYYVWSALEPGEQIADGDDVGGIHMRFSRYNSYVVPHDPTGRSGTMEWRSELSWTEHLQTHTRTRPRAVIPGVGGVAGPVIWDNTLDLYTHHAELFASGGDVDASEGDVVGPAHEFRIPVPEGSVFDGVFVTWQSDGPYEGIDVSTDFGLTSHDPTDDKLRISVTPTLPQGLLLPEQRKLEAFASPQYTVPVTVGASTSSSEPAGVGHRLTANVLPGDHRVVLMALRQPDGSMRTRRLELDRPGRYEWSIERGRLVPESGPARAQSPTAAAPSREVEGPDANAAAALSEPAEGSAEVGVNEAGRPVLRSMRVGGELLLEEYDIPRIQTPSGLIELSSENRDGRAVMWRSPDGRHTQAAAAYRADGVWVLVRMWFIEDELGAYVDSHSLDGTPRPHTVEGVADPPEGGLFDILTGTVHRSFRVLPSEVSQRFELEAGDRRFDVWALPDTVETWVSNGGDPPTGEPLEDATLVTRVARDPVWWYDSPMAFVAPSASGRVAGAFSSVETYRLDTIIPQPTRDLDGAEPFAIALGARDEQGDPITADEVDWLFLSLHTLDGNRLLEASFDELDFTPDGGATWGVRLFPNGELRSSEIVIFARAGHQGGVVSTASSPGVSPRDWRFGVDRIPVSATASAGGEVQGATAPLAAVTASIPELGMQEQTRADQNGSFSVSFDLDGLASGDYDCVVRAVTPVPNAGSLVGGTGDLIPDDEVGMASVRIRHLEGGEDPLPRDRSGVDVPAAVTFLSSREADGAFDGSLRATSSVAQGLSAIGEPVPGSTRAYLDSLRSGPGWGWAGGLPNASATGLASMAEAALGGEPTIEPFPFLRFDGGAAPAPATDVSTVEAAALLVLGLQASGQLDGLDPWWRLKVRGFLEGSVESLPAASFHRAQALSALGANGSASIDGDDLDPVVFRILRGDAPMEEGFGRTFQGPDGGFSVLAMGDTSEAYPTGLALLAAAKHGAS